MKLKYVILFSLFLILGSSCSGSFKLAKPTFHTLKNGMKVFVLEDHSLPTFRLTAFHPAGAVFESDKERGLAPLTAETLRTGGTKKKTPAEVDKLVSEASATLEFSASRSDARMSLSVLKDDRETMLKLLAELLQSPRFDAMAFEVARRQAQVALRRQKEKPMGVASLYFSDLIYGDQSPWSAVATEAGLAALTVQQAQQFFKQQYFPERMVLGVAGDFETKSLLNELEATLGQWGKKESVPVSWPGIEPQKLKQIFMPMNAAQVAIRMGHLGKKRTDPDKYAILVANFILGGSGALTSRLGSEIRSSQGQAYSVWSQYGFNRVPGIFLMAAQTEASQQVSVIQSMQRILGEMQKNGVKKEALEAAKAAILRSLNFDYESRFAIAKDWARFEFWGYKRDYLNIFRRGIEKVDVKTVNRVLKEDFHPDHLSLLVVGPEHLWPLLKSETSTIRRQAIP